MGVQKENMYIKNIGYFVAFMTLFWGVWYTLIHLQNILFEGGGAIFLRIIGVFFLAFMSYVPFVFLHRILRKAFYSFFILGFCGVFFLFDLFLRITNLFGIYSDRGFILLLGSSIALIMSTLFAFFTSYCVKILTDKRSDFMHVGHIVKKGFLGIFNRRFL